MAQKQTAWPATDTLRAWTTTTDARRAQKTWQAEKARFAVTLPQVPSGWQACVQYWKATLEAGGYYSLPSTVYEVALNKHDHDFEGYPDPLQASFAVADEGLKEFDTCSDFVIFRLVKAWPEKRYHITLPHKALSSTTIHVTRQECA